MNCYAAKAAYNLARDRFTAARRAAAAAPTASEAQAAADTLDALRSEYARAAAALAETNTIAVPR